MDAIQVIMGTLTGALLLSGILSISLALKGYETKLNISYFFLSVFLIVNILTSVLRYQTFELSLWVVYEKLQNLSLQLAGGAFVFFISYLTGSMSVKKIIPHIIILSGMIIINISSPYGIIYTHIDRINIDNISNFNNIVTGIPSQWNFLIILYMVYLLFFIGMSLNFLYKSGEKRRTVFLGLAVGLAVLGILTDLVFIQFRLLNFPFIEIIGLSVFIIIVTQKNFSNIIIANSIKDELLEAEKRYRTLIESSPDAIIVELKGEILYANKLCFESLGAKAFEEVTNKSVFDFIHPSSKDQVIARHDYILEHSVPLPPAEIKIIKLNGEVIDIEMRSAPVNYGGIKAIQSILRDITEKKKAEIELRKLSKAVEQSSVAIFISDKYGFIEYVNPKFEEVTGYKSSEVIGKRSKVLLAGDIPVEKFDKLWDTINSGEIWRGELLNKRKNGELYWGLDIISPIKNNNGETIHFVAIKEDISVEKKNHEEILKAKEEAEQANKIKSSLLSNFSHEFRTPLNGILGFSQILKEILPDETHVEMAEKINKSGERLLNTINSVLFLTEIENKTYVVTEIEIDLTLFCHNIIVEYEKLAAIKNLELRINVPNEPIWIVIDETLLTRSVSAIIENAIKYTKTGRITINLDLKTDESGNENAYLQISDTGIGIKKENLSIVFREFTQVSEGYGREFEGLGLGLALASKMAGLIGCRISLQSEYGKGSDFVYEIPVKRTDKIITLPREQKIPEKISSNENLPEILLVEDNKINIEVMELYLNGFCRLSSAGDGIKAIKLAAEKNFDLLLIDINLGIGYNGIETLAEIRKMRGYENVPAIAITGYASDQNRREIISKGFNGFLAKPYNKTELLLYIKSVFEKELV